MSVVRVTLTTLLTTALLATAACGQSSEVQAGGSMTPTSPGPSGGSTSGAAGHADLTIVVHNGTATTTWHLTCSPDGGDHPTPAKACSVLAQRGATAIPPVPADRMCTQIYGGPQTAHVTGTWRGKPVDASFSRTDGCQTARWDALAGLLPAQAAGA
jgi:hypothetical protein